jgi:hypothetical protein
VRFARLISLDFAFKLFRGFFALCAKFYIDPLEKILPPPLAICAIRALDFAPPPLPTEIHATPLLARLGRRENIGKLNFPASIFHFSLGKKIIVFFAFQTILEK